MSACGLAADERLSRKRLTNKTWKSNTMDLPTCPACGQSVLDDDADECPFCGASMSGKPTATATKPSPGAATATRKESVKTTAASSPPIKRTATAPSEEKIVSDDPFELERTADAKKRVVQLRLKPEPGRRHEVQCPMCETVGYTGRKAAGMDVKCANPNCTFPLFTAPPLDEADEEPAEKPPEETQPAAGTLFTRDRIIAYSVIAVAAGIALWYFAFRRTPHPKLPGGGPAPPPIVNPGPNGKKPPVVQVKETKKDKPGLRTELLTIREEALKLMVTHSGLIDPLTGLKPLAWQWTVDAHARAGEFDGAREHMQRLRVVTKSGPFYRALPLIATAWKHMERGTPGDVKAGKQALQDALVAAERLPQRGHWRYNISSELAAALFAAGRATEAEAKIADHDGRDAAAQASLFAHRIHYLENYDAEAALRNRGIAGPQSPSRVAVTFILAGHGRWKQAWDWAVSQPEGAVRDDCLIAWAEMRFGTRQMPIATKSTPGKDGKKTTKAPNLLPHLDEAAARLSDPAARGTLYARVAFRLQDRKQGDDARTVLAKARNALKTIKAKVEPKPPSIKDVFTYAVTSDAERGSRRRAASALAELGRAELRVDPQTGQAAWTALARALVIARSIAPSPVEIARMVDEVKVGNDRVARNELRRITGLDKDALDQKVKEYRGHVKRIDAAAAFRFDLEKQLLVAAANWGAYEKSKSPAFLQLLWKDVESGTQKAAGVGRENWYGSRIPWLLAGNAELIGDAQLAKDIRGKIGARRHPSRRQFAWDPFLAALREKRFDAAAAKLSDPRLDSNWVSGVVLAQTSRFANADDLNSGKRFLRAFQDRLLKMDALYLLAARATFLGKAEDVWAGIHDDALDSPQKVAMCYGLIVALPIPPPEQETKKNP
jgi:hypothetical protein